MYGKSRGAYRFLVAKSEGKRPLGKPARRWEDTNKMNLQEMGLIDMAWHRERWRTLVNTV
jgi:hypothetical protein